MGCIIVISRLSTRRTFGFVWKSEVPVYGTLKVALDDHPTYDVGIWPGSAESLVAKVVGDSNTTQLLLDVVQRFRQFLSVQLGLSDCHEEPIST